jgi:hypothetical protein
MTTTNEATAGTKKLITPTLYIGVGGTGLETLKALKEINKQSYKTDIPVIQYLSIDIRDNTEKLDPLETTEQLDLTADQKVKSADKIFESLEQHYPQILTWMPNLGKWTKFKNITKITEGADQCRALGRFIFNLLGDKKVHSAIDIALKTITGNEARALIGQTNEFGVHPNKGPDVFIVGSICGGTGSGIFLDLAYLCRHVGKSYGSMKVFGVFGLPNLFPVTDAEKIRINAANGYAALKELNYYMDTMSYEMPYSTIIVKSNTAPFDQCFLLDSPNESGMGFDIKDPKQSFLDATRMIANGIFCLSTSVIQSSYAEYLTNFISRQSIPEKNNVGTEYPSSFSSFGVASIDFPYHEYLDYCTYRRVKELLNRLSGDPSTQKGDKIILDNASSFINHFSLVPELLRSELTSRVDTTFNNWFVNAKDGLVEDDKKLCVNENTLIGTIKTEKANLDSAVPKQKQAVTFNADKILESVNGSDKIQSFFRKLLNNINEGGIQVTLKTIENIQSALTSHVEILTDKAEKEAEDNKRKLKSYENIIDEDSFDEDKRPLGPIKRLADQHFIKDLFDWDKKEELANLTIQALTYLRDGANDAITAHIFKTTINIYNEIGNKLSDIKSDIQAIKDLLNDSQINIGNRCEKVRYINARKGISYKVLRDGHAASFYEDLYSGNDSSNLSREIRLIFEDRPLSQWKKVFDNGDKLIDFLDIEHIRPWITSKLMTDYTIYSELVSTGVVDDYITTNLLPASASYISTNPAFTNNSREMVLLGRPGNKFIPVSGKKTATQVMELIKRDHDVTPVDINNPFSLTLMRSRCIFPLFSLTSIEDWKKQCELERGFGDNPCYSIKDDIVSAFKDITPNATEALNIYHRAVHAFDLGVMTGFLVKRPRGKVYYFCEVRNDIDTGFAIKGGTGGGRRQTKEWLMDAGNRSHLEKLEGKIKSILMNMDKATFDQFEKDWAIFRNKATAKSKKQKEWMSHDDRKIPDYPVNGKNPVILAKARKAKTC